MTYDVFNELFTDSKAIWFLIVLLLIFIIRTGYKFLFSSEYENLLLTKYEKSFSYFMKSLLPILLLLIAFFFFMSEYTYDKLVEDNVIKIKEITAFNVGLIFILIMIFVFFIIFIESIRFIELKYCYFVDLDSNGTEWEFMYMTNKNVILFQSNNIKRYSSHWDNKDITRKLDRKKTKNINLYNNPDKLIHYSVPCLIVNGLVILISLIYNENTVSLLFFIISSYFMALNITILSNYIILKNQSQT